MAKAKEAAYGGRPARLQGGPPLHTRFQKGQSGNPGGRSQKKLHALLDALSEQVFVAIDGERRKITKREAVVHQLVNKSATADLRATRMLFEMLKDVEQKASVTSSAPEPRRLDAADKEVVQQLVDRIRRQILAQMGAETIEVAGAEKR
jgi:ribosomal protein L17